jgi:hypothetical protein
MTQLQRAGQSGALDVAASQAAAKEQIATLLDMMRQLGGNAAVVAGDSATADPLNAPFTLYVDPYIGSDRFVGGAYNDYEATGTDEEIIAQKLKRIELQRLECGYTSARPFKTINRAAIEAAIITSKDWYTYSDPRAHVDCVTIVLSGGVHIVYNDPGSSSTSLTSWGTSKDPTVSELIAFNPITGGVLLPRGCSMHGQDLRKTTIRPNWVTAVADEAADYSNRRAILKVSGTGFFFNASTMDKIGHTASVHLLDCFQPASKAELDAFYSKVESAVGTGADLATALLVTRPSEYSIVGPIDQSQSPTSAWDTTTGASPYIFNWSLRSEYGMGGAFWDGAKLEGLKSMVCANFTGTNQQKDMTCWQVYENGAWVSLTNTTQDYQKYIDAAPDNVRRNPARQTRHISAINNAYIQKVSIFGIGQSEVTMVDSGGEITDNGGNSTFGGCSALAKGYKGFAFKKDQDWAVGRIRVPLNLSEKTSNIRRIELGVVASVTASAITLTNGLAISSNSTTNPAILQSQGYTFAAGTRIWIDNPTGDDWRATLSSSAWSSASPAAIGITAAPLQSGTNAPAGDDAVGRRVYIRRLVDTRTVAERRCSAILYNTASVRLPQRNTVLQTDPNRSNGAISRVLAAGGEEVLLVSASGAGPAAGVGVTRTAEVTLRRGAPSKSYASGTYYRQGTVVKHAGKHWQAISTFTSSGSNPDPSLWGECFVHMPSDFNPEEPLSQEAPILVLDTDTSDADDSTTLGINWSTVWTSAGTVRDQYRTGTDYLGVYGFLRALGFADADAHAALVPQVAASRDRDPDSATDFPVAPSGGAATGRGNWAVEFRRPSTIRLYNHQWEWAGFGNYSKAMPAVQQDMSEFNKFTYYFTNAAGGRVTPKGSNEDGFEVSPKGLEDIATGVTISPESLGGQALDEAQLTDFPNGIQVGGTAQLQDVLIAGNAEFGSQSQAKTNRTGVVRLATIEQLTATGGNAPTAGTNTALDAAPDAVTIGGLNRWRQAQRLISADTGTITIFVKAGAADRNLDSMFASPPTTAANAIPTLARASEYANAVIGGGNQLALIRIAPGLYDPASVWQCNVRLESWNAALTARIWASNNTGSTTVANNYFDGSGWEDFTNAVNFWCYRLALRSATTSGNNLHIFVQPRQMVFERSVTFLGGFHCLGLAEQIKAVNGGSLSRTDMVSAPVVPAITSFTATLSSNVDTLLSAIRVSNSITGSSNNPAYLGIPSNSLIALRGGIKDTAILNDLVIGPGLPTRKDALSIPHSPLITIEGDANTNLANFYIRGKTTITSAGMGVTGNLPAANQAHYGSSAVASPWTWEQTYHTLIGVAPNTAQVMRLSFGSNKSFNANPAVNNTSTYFIDGSPTGGKILPNHILLLTNAGAAPADNDTGPFFDQFIHAPSELIVTSSWPSAGEGAASNLARLQGFVGRFGRNGYNSVKTRGFVGGNAGGLDPETGFKVTLANTALANSGRSIFQRAGISTVTVDADARVTYDGGSPDQGFGLGNPAGANPVITADGSGTVALNVGLRSYRRGISTEFAITIPATNVIL